ncbi:MAG: molecular chaperone TorD family protein [Halofilum sp. (in: g-proteobacteria)]|nr:molecular chaperone TorD family protein [Halofilum sp. (in: g-proteobacteria)]
MVPHRVSSWTARWWRCAATCALLGFERQADVREPEDHAGALAEVMGLLADPAEGQDESTQRLFFSEHIDSWMPAPVRRPAGGEERGFLS